MIRDFVFSEASVRGYDNVGIVFGLSNTTFYMPFYNASKTVERVSIKGSAVGNSHVGLVGGLLDRYGVVSSVEATGYVSGGDYVGGLLGRNDGSLLNSTFSGSINGEGNVGGLAGDGVWGNGYITNSYYDIDETEINGGHAPTVYGVYSLQFNNWLSSDKAGLKIEDYSSVLRFDDGCGCYKVDSVQGLRYALPFVLNPEYKFSLETDINISGNDGFHFPLFRASLDGHGHSISNIFVDSPLINNQGFFGVLTGNIKDVILSNVNINGFNYVGAFAGVMGGSLDRVMAWGSVKGNLVVGGLVGEFDSGSISQAASIINVTGGNYVGGIAGYADRYDGGGISDSYSSGEVVGDNSVGGVLGYAWNALLHNVYSSGKVNGVTKVGGLVGQDDGFSYADNSYWSTEAGKVYDGSSLGAGVTAMQLKDVKTFINWDITAQAGESIWRLYDGKTMPMLRNLLTPVTVSAGSKVYDGKTLTGLDRHRH